MSTVFFASTPSHNQWLVIVGSDLNTPGLEGFGRQIPDIGLGSDKDTEAQNEVFCSGVSQQCPFGKNRGAGLVYHHHVPAII